MYNYKIIIKCPRNESRKCLIHESLWWPHLLLAVFHNLFKTLSYPFFFSDTLFFQDFSISDIISKFHAFREREPHASLLVYVTCSDEGKGQLQMLLFLFWIFYALLISDFNFE